ncbi:hypothetical protein RHPLAN_52390 [Rhodoplanes sp. Z2-YC6860]|nr:hypothetical protein RHPLAN_52390 [Rhodoplanes sp. Z2-YC6860]
MTMPRLAALLTLLVFAMASGAQAQEHADMSKVTCSELTSVPLEDAVATGIWLSGYYNGKRNRTVVNLQNLRANTKLVIEHCQKNPKKTVMQAVEALAKSIK